LRSVLKNVIIPVLKNIDFFTFGVIFSLNIYLQFFNMKVNKTLIFNNKHTQEPVMEYWLDLSGMKK